LKDQEGEVEVHQRIYHLCLEQYTNNLYLIRWPLIVIFPSITWEEDLLIRRPKVECNRRSVPPKGSNKMIYL
jgi:hypothetical protein